MLENNQLIVAGAFADRRKISLLFSSQNKMFGIAESENAEEFQMTEKISSVVNCHLNQLDSIDIGHFAVLRHKKYGLMISLSRDKKKWSRPHRITPGDKCENFTTCVLIPEYQKDGSYFMLLGGGSAHLATSKDAKKWQIELSSLGIPVANGETIEIDLAKKLSKGILICYRLVQSNGQKDQHRVHMALLDSHDPTQIIWRSSDPIWENDPTWGEVHFGGAVVYRSQVYSFWNTVQSGAISVRYSVDGIPSQLPKDHVIALERDRLNPVIFPRSEFPWESFATYNPAAFFADGRVHILYRAQGPDLISSIGYASSADGVHIDERLESPVYYPQEVFESFQKASPADVEQKYVSGGGVAGCEDPRVTLIDDRVYMTYVAFDGASPPRSALTSIALDDFLARNWNWEKPVLISQPGVVDKSTVIFPEKINGKYILMHRIFPNIQIDSSSDLNFDGSRWLKEESKISIRDNMWDSRKIGAGAPPIKTSEGWLLIYYGVDDRDDRFYKMGAMLLDLEDPTKVLYRSSTPILEPEDWYENSGFKPGIVYPCGAVVLKEKLFVYYGGADCVVCVASRNLKSFLEALKSNGELKLQTQRVLRIGQHATHTIPIKSYSYT